VLYDRAKLDAVGGFDFWRDLPAAHCGEDVVAERRVMARFGGAGILPSGAYHLESPTTVPDREHNASNLLVDPAEDVAGGCRQGHPADTERREGHAAGIGEPQRAAADAGTRP
jgi:hypothetical protein